MLYVLGIGSAIALAGALITIISDQFPNWRYIYIVTGTCIFGFCAGIIYCTPVSNISMIIYIILKMNIMNVHSFFFFKYVQGGQFILELVDYYAGSFIVFILATLEIIGIFWVYGLENFLDDVEYMLKRRPSVYWRLCWTLVVPILLAVILVYTIINLKPLTYSGISYPDSAHGLYLLYYY